MIGLIVTLLMVFMPIYNSTKYDKVIGVITDDRIFTGSRSSKKGTKTTKTYYIDFKYEYNGVEYSATRQIPTPSKKDKKVVGSELDVYVNPENPEKVTFLYGNNAGYFGLVIMILYNIGIMYRFIKDYKEITMNSGQFKNDLSK